MGKKAAQMPKQEDEDQVKLKPVMGIRPGVYLVFLYSFILIAVLFFLLVFPGLKNPGSVLVVKSNPQGAGIRVNGVYMGASGSRIFLPKGSYTIQAVMPGFNSISAIHEIPGRIFGSLFFPHTYNVEFALSAADPAAAFALYAGDFAAWSFGGEPTETWQIPLSLSEGAYRIGGALRENAAAEDQLHEILTAASRFTVTRAGLKDLVRAKVLLDNHGLAPSPVSLLGSISGALEFLSENPGSAAWLANLLPPRYADAILSSSWGNVLSVPSNIISAPQQDTFTLDIAGIMFTRLSPGVLTGGPVTFHRMNPSTDIDSIMIAENPVSRSSFETFLTENPQWTEHLTDYFPEEVSAYPAGSYGREIISGITWYAAEAFCKWLTTRLPPAMADMEVRLPKEAEWEYAALSGIARMGIPGWEWCADPFAPLQFIAAGGEAVSAVGSPERSLRTSFARTSFTQTSSASRGRASLPPEFSSPFVTFRPVIAPKE